MSQEPIEPPALIGLKNPGAGIVQCNATQAHQSQEEAEVLAHLEKKLAALVGWPQSRNHHIILRIRIREVAPPPREFTVKQQAKLGRRVFGTAAEPFTRTPWLAWTAPFAAQRALDNRHAWKHAACHCP